VAVSHNLLNLRGVRLRDVGRACAEEWLAAIFATAVRVRPSPYL
jgi:hypothetical protein